MNWVLINDEKYFGITAHYIDEGIDTGDIILQKKFPINDKDNYQSLLSVAYFNCPKILINALNLIKDSKVNRIPQKNIDLKGSYCRKRVIGDELISWSWTSRKIFNFIRSISYPGPHARSIVKNKEILIKKSELTTYKDYSEKTPGTILSLDNTGILVKTIDSTLKITEYTFNADGNYSLNINDIFEN